MQQLFSYSFYQGRKEDTIDQIVSHLANLDKQISDSAPEWPLAKISNVDRSVLRMGLAELLFGDREQVPPKVAINEAIELAKTFGGENTKPVMDDLWYEDGGGNASRFFKSIIYQAKANKSERNKGCEGMEEKEGIRTNAPRENEDVKTPTRANNHPTVKPIALMEYLIKMVTPKGGVVLDPFAGSGSTLVAAKQNGFNYVGIEMTEEYIPIIEARLSIEKPNTLF